MTVYFRKWGKKDSKAGGAWYWNFMVSGIKSHTRARHPDNPKQKARTRKEALVFEAIARQRIASNIPIFDKQTRTQNFREFVESVFKPYSEANHRGFERDRYYLKVLCETFGDLNFDQISPFAIEKFKIEQVKRGLSGNTIRLYLAFGSDVFRLAIGEGKAKSNPFLKVAIPEITPREKRRLQPEEEEALMKACYEPERIEAEGRRDYLAGAIIIMLELGPRPTELFNLKIEDIDRSERLVKFTSYKTGRRRRSLQPKDRWIPATARAWSEIERLRSLAKSDRLYPYDSVKKAWGSACKEARLSGFWFRWLRDEAASRWAEGGANPYEIAYLLGHSDIAQGQRSITRMSMIYVRPMLERMREMMERASNSRNKQEEIYNEKQFQE